MALLAKILSSQVRAEVFRILFNKAQPGFHLRDLQRKSGVSIRAMQKEISYLKELDLISLTRDGNRLYIKANDEHPLFKEICQIVEKTSGISEQLRTMLQTLTGIDAAFIFGSVAKGKEKSHSDIDLIVIGEVGLRTLAPKLKKITDQTGREVNPHIYSKKSWTEKLKKKDHFLSTVKKESKIFLVGSEDVIG